MLLFLNFAASSHGQVISSCKKHFSTENCGTINNNMSWLRLRENIVKVNDNSRAIAYAASHKNTNLALRLDKGLITDLGAKLEINKVDKALMTTLFLLKAIQRIRS